MMQGRPVLGPLLRPVVLEIGERRLAVPTPPPPDPSWNDDFTSDTLSQYTLTYDAGAPTASISGGELSINTSAITEQAVLTYNDALIQNGYIEALIASAADSGLVFRFQDNANYYLLAISDDSGLGSPNLRIWKKVTGSWIALGSGVNMDWSRGSDRLIRLGATGSTIEVAIDEVSVFTWEDSSIPGFGKVGMRSSSGQPHDKFKAVRWVSNDQ